MRTECVRPNPIPPQGVRNMSDLRVDSPDSFPGWIMPWPGFEVDWSRAGLLVVDMQNYSSNPACGIAQMLIERYPDVARYYVPRIDDAVANTRRLLEAFRSSEREVVFTRHGALLGDGRDMIARRQQRDDQAREQTDRPHAVGQRKHGTSGRGRDCSAGSRTGDRQERQQRLQRNGHRSTVAEHEISKR